MLRQAALAICLGLSGAAQGQTVDLPPVGTLPPQVIPAAADPGTPAFAAVSQGGDIYGSTAVTPDPVTGQIAGIGGGTYGTPGTGTGTNYGGTPSVDRGDVLAALQQQPYGQTAVSTADKLGVNSTGVAAFAAAESDFRNIAAGNGTTSATGPWQITGGTWDSVVKQFNLPYTSADRADPNAQAVVSSYLIRSYGGATSQSLGRVATVQETYYSYVFGPAVGGKIAQADASTPLGNIVPANFLSNNGMTGWSVGNLQTFTAQRLGSSATQPIFAART